MAIESPTGGPNDVVFNTNGLALLWCYSGFPCFARGNLLSGIAIPYLVETAPGRSLP